ncbi:MAG TPA: hypothetical protein VM491_15180 [Burkholderiaceae bacterium]|nr:hypothetical protein [Burkholderiaceae bacterium]
MRILLILLAALSATMLSGCEAIAAIFQAGVWLGIVVAIIIIVAIALLMGRRKGP